MTRRYYPISTKVWTTEDALDFSRDALIRDGRKLIEENHPELLDRKAQGSIIDEQAKALATLRRKHAILQMEKTNLELAIHTYINWSDILVAERDARIAELEKFLSRWFDGVNDFNSPLFFDDNRLLTDEESKLLDDTRAILEGEVK